MRLRLLVLIAVLLALHVCAAQENADPNAEDASSDDDSWLSDSLTLEGLEAFEDWGASIDEAEGDESLDDLTVDDSEEADTEDLPMDPMSSWGFDDPELWAEEADADAADEETSDGDEDSFLDDLLESDFEDLDLDEEVETELEDFEELEDSGLLGAGSGIESDSDFEDFDLDEEVEAELADFEDLEDSDIGAGFGIESDSETDATFDNTLEDDSDVSDASVWEDDEEFRSVRMLKAAQAAGGASDSADLQYDDGSVDESAIPSGYFQQQRGGGRGQRLEAGSIRFPGLRVPISPGFASRAWWEYNTNVCVSKKVLRQQRRDRGISLFSQYGIRCSQRNITHYECTIRIANSRCSRLLQLTYSCCPGFTRLPDDRGCPRSEDPSRNRTLTQLLRQLGYTASQAQLFNSTLAGGGQRSAAGWTVFVPSQRAMTEFADAVLRNYTASRPPRHFVQSVLNHVSPGARHSGSFGSGERLPTLAGAGAGLLASRAADDSQPPLVNCVPLLRTDLPFDNFSFVHVASRELPAPNASVYTELRRLALDVWRIDAAVARQILQPLKKALSDTRRMVTVFVHKPTEIELSAGCYARNLLAAAAAGVHCSQRLAAPVRRLRSLGGEFLDTWSRSNSTFVGRGALVTRSDVVATNGLLHVLNISAVAPVLENAAYQRLKTSAEFNASVFSPGASPRVTFLLPPDSEAADAMWRSNASSLAKFGRRHLAIGGQRRRTLRMLDGSRRRLQTVVTVSPAGRTRRRFVDCVPIRRTVSNCDGSIFHLLQDPLPVFNESQPLREMLQRNENYTAVARLLSFMLDNVSSFRQLANRSDLSIALLRNDDLHLLTGRALQRRSFRRRGMLRLAAWYWRYFVRGQDRCALRRGSSYNVATFWPRRCRSLACELLAPRRFGLVATDDVALPLREGFALFARLRQ